LRASISHSLMPIYAWLMADIANMEGLAMDWPSDLKALECASENADNCEKRMETHLSKGFDNVVQARMFQQRTLRPCRGPLSKGKFQRGVSYDL
jgi:hypothetical protein